MMARILIIARALFLIFVFPGILVSQTVQHGATLTVNGEPGEAPVIQVDGRSYVDLEALARILNGSLGFQGNQISLALAGSPASSAPVESAPNPPASSFSKEFLRAGIEEMTVLREWRSALMNAVENGYPVAEDWMSGYRGQAATNLRLATVAASTDSDRNGAQLLARVFDKMARLSDQVVTARRNMNYIGRDSLKNDPLDQEILTCARSLAAMAANGAFQDDGACH